MTVAGPLVVSTVVGLIVRFVSCGGVVSLCDDVVVVFVKVVVVVVVGAAVVALGGDVVVVVVVARRCRSNHMYHRNRSLSRCSGSPCRRTCRCTSECYTDRWGR